MRLTSAILLLSAVSLGLGSCSDDDNDYVPTPPESEAVGFTVAVPRAPRTSRAATTSSSIEEFRTWAFYNGANYMSNVTVKRSGDEWTYSPLMYWPADGSLNFYCISPMIDNTTQLAPVETHIPDYINTAGTTDLLYAVTKGATAGTTGKVKINFRHALSQVQVNLKRKEASSTQAAIRVDVKEVGFTAICQQGSFMFPNATTDSKTDVTGTWSDVVSPVSPKVYVGFDQLEDKYVNFNSTGYMFAIPQTLQESVDAGNSSYEGSYIRVLCSIYDEKSGVKIWPSASTPAEDMTDGDAYIYFPIASAELPLATKEWKAGKSYVYNITVGVPQGSSIIDFDVTVDDYNDFE